MRLSHVSTLASVAFCALTLSLGFSLVACGSSSSGKDDNKGPNGIEEFETMDDLVHCTKSHYGEVAYVTETDSIYECTSEGWVAADSTRMEELLESSDSGSDDGKSSAGEASDSTASSSSEQASAEDTTSVEVVKVDSASVVGYAQKGPFVSGATVTVYGLDSAYARLPKMKFTGKVGADSGSFSVSGIVLESQYAELEVSGFYTNALTGKNTSGTKTKLTALVDLSSSKKVHANVNLFTEFEKARALALVANEKYNVPAAKMRASREIVNAFAKNFGGKNVDSASVPAVTALSLSDTGAVGAALYAAGIMMTANLNISKSASLIAAVSEDIAADGSWNSDTTRTTVADNLCYQDSLDGFSTARTNLKNMKMASAVPDFEANLRYFWYENYGLGECTDDQEADATIRKVTNKLSDNYGAGYACTSKRWHKTNALDAELGFCTAKMEGTYKESALDEFKKDPYFVCKQGTWNNISEVQYNLKECTADKAESEATAYVAVKDSFFLCKDLQWSALTDVQYELKNCTEALNNTMKKATADGVTYVCRDGEWETATDLEVEFGLCLTVDSTTFKTLNETYYACLASGWTKITDIEGVNGFCISEKVNTTGKKANGDVAYVCDAQDGEYAWRNATAQELAFGLCLTVDSTTFKTLNETYYACLASGWTAVSDTVGINGFCTSENANTTGKNANGDVAYMCINTTWTACASDVVGEVAGDYVCENSASGFAWRELSDFEKKFGYCLSSIKDSIAWSGRYFDPDTNASLKTLFENPFPDATDETGEFMECDGTSWKSSNGTRFYYGTTCSDGELNAYWDTTTVLNLTGKTKADYPGNIITQFAYAAATSSYVVDGSDTNKYVICKNNDWEKISEIEYNYGFCTESIADSMIKISSKKFYACIKNSDSNNYGWEEISETEYNYGFCTGKIADSIATINSEKFYRCVYNTSSLDYGWVLVQQSSFKDARDGHTYKSVTIGPQTWMAQNLNYAYNEKTSSLDSSSFCYNDVDTYCSKYGRLYLWSAAMDSAAVFSENSKGCGHNVTCTITQPARGICPEGWHIPTFTEWKTLFNNIGGTDNVGTMFKSTSGWYNSGNGKDSYGFSILPAGQREDDDGFSDLGYNAYFWCSTSIGDVYASRWNFRYGYSSIDKLDNYNFKYRGYSVRCIKD